MYLLWVVCVWREVGGGGNDCVISGQIFVEERRVRVLSVYVESRHDSLI